MIIRPPRHHYEVAELGPPSFRLGEKSFVRRDLQLTSCRGHKLECSHFLPQGPAEGRPCVVYLHGASSCRLEALSVLPTLLPLGFTVFCLDLSGSGRSGGEYVSLGHHEEKDLGVALAHLRSLDSVTTVGVWGRSMGASTAIFRAHKDQRIQACVLDSPFRDLRTLAIELVSRGVKVPNFLLDICLKVVRGEVQKRAGFDPAKLTPIKCAPNARCPALFGAASDDDFIAPHHARDLHNVWGGEHSLKVFTGGHNGTRPDWFLQDVARFFGEHLAQPEVPRALGQPAQSGRRHWLMRFPRRRADAGKEGDARPGGKPVRKRWLWKRTSSGRKESDFGDMQQVAP